MCSQHRHIACELNDVPKSLVRVNQDRLSRYAFLTKPYRHEIIHRKYRKTCNAPSRFASLPSRLEISEQQIIICLAKLGVGVGWIDGPDVLVQRKEFIEAVQLSQHLRLGYERQDERWLEPERPVEPLQRFLKSIEQLKRVGDT